MEKQIIEIAKPFSFEVNGFPHIATPSGFSSELAKEVLPCPVRDKRIVNLVDTESFCQYLEIHKSDRAAVHINVMWPESCCLATGYCDDGNAGTTSWRDHQVNLIPKLTKDFEDWNRVDAQELEQMELVQFLDRHLMNIVQPEKVDRAPSAAEVMSFASNLSDVKKVEFKKSVNLSNGRVQLTYNELDADGAAAQITIPKEFWIKLQPIVGHPAAYVVRVALRYKIKDGARLRFTLELRDLQPLMRALREEIIADLRKGVGPTPVFLSSW